MKRFILAAAVAASLLAMPAGASAADTTAADVSAALAACPGCVQAIEEALQADRSPCNWDETYTECAFRILREAPEDALYRAEAYVNYVGYVLGTTIDTIKDLCGQVSRPCGGLL